MLKDDGPINIFFENFLRTLFPQEPTDDEPICYVWTRYAAHRRAVTALFLYQGHHEG